MSQLIVPYIDQAVAQAATLRTDRDDERRLTTLTVAEVAQALRIAGTITHDEVEPMRAVGFGSSDVPNLGGRLVGALVPIRQVEGELTYVGTGVNGTCVEVADAAPHVARPSLSDASFTKVGAIHARFRVCVDCHESVLRDRGLVAAALDFLLQIDLGRTLDAEAINGDATGDRWDGLLHVTLPTAAKGTDSHFGAVMKAARAVRAAGWAAPLAVVANSTDAFDLVTERESRSGIPLYVPEHWAAVGGLPFGSGGLVITDQIPQGTVLVGAWANAATVWMRQGVTVSASVNVSDDRPAPKVELVASTGASLHVGQPSALFELTAM